MGFFLAHLSRRLGARGGGGGGRVLDKSQLAGLQNPSRRPPPPTPVWKEAVVAAAPPCPGSFQGALAAEAVGLLGGGAGICTYSCGGCGDGLSFFLLLLYADVVPEAGPAHLRMMQRLSASAGD